MSEARRGVSAVALTSTTSPSTLALALTCERRASEVVPSRLAARLSTGSDVMYSARCLLNRTKLASLTRFPPRTFSSPGVFITSCACAVAWLCSRKPAPALMKAISRVRASELHL